MGGAATRRVAVACQACPRRAVVVALLLFLAGLVGSLVAPLGAAAASVPLRSVPRALLAQAPTGTPTEAAEPTAVQPGESAGTDDVAPGEAAGADVVAPADEAGATDVPAAAEAAPDVQGAAPAPSAEAVPTVGPAATAQPAPRPVSSEPLDFPGAAVDVTLKLVAVLALAYLTLALIKRYSLGGALGKRSGTLQVIESTTLAPNRSIYLVNVEGRRLLLGVTNSQITTLAAWDGEGLPQAVPAPAPVALDEAAATK